MTPMLFALAALTLTAQPMPTSDIELSFDGLSEDGQVDFEKAAMVWERCLVSEAPIRIRVSKIDRGPTGFAYQNVVRNKRYLPVKDAWYPTALASALRGKRVSDEDDINIFIKEEMGDETRHYSRNDPIPEDGVDMINVALHEIGHGLGLSSATFVPWEGEPLGAIGRPNGFVNYFNYSFTLHEQDGTPQLYDTFLKLADGRKITEDFGNPSLGLTFALANPTIHFDGPEAEKANNGFPVGVTPLNVSHIPAFPRAPTPVMLSNSGRGESIRNPDKIMLGMLRDLGWTITEACYDRGA
ncbi:hypothetical protein HK107_07195 [Parvularcula sp. ZS-1/3]|uniref:Uncharacterized protein n=1 Tax=Parvularcula mediterranea TaxID=2732508 RepID=A0A7Y3RLA6_9PROT|nr:hypothetical protein [Parvularcula mediterranea]NNU16105.1 hypothetical protein [Parvularcula mediterranea]